MHASGGQVRQAAGPQYPSGAEVLSNSKGSSFGAASAAYAVEIGPSRDGETVLSVNAGLPLSALLSEAGWPVLMAN